MNDGGIMSLLWKDWRAARSLVMAAIGGENEERTFDWLRTLPVSWQRVLLSKLVVCVAGWLIVLAAATLGLWLCDAWLQRSINVRIFDGNLDWEKSLSPLVIGVIVLFASSITSMTVRTPLLAAILVFPLLYVTSILTALVFEWSMLQSMVDWFSGFSNTVQILCGVAVWLGLAMVVLVMSARRRLTGPSEEPWMRRRFPKPNRRSRFPTMTRATLRCDRVWVIESG